MSMSSLLMHQGAKVSKILFFIYSLPALKGSLHFIIAATLVMPHKSKYSANEPAGGGGGGRQPVFVCLPRCDPLRQVSLYFEIPYCHSKMYLYIFMSFAIFTLGNNFCDLLFDSLNEETLLKWDLLLQDPNCKGR